MPLLELVSPFTAAGDQPEAIEALATGVERGDRYQTLLGITGSGKSFTIAGAIARAQRPTLVLAPNKSLAAQLAAEFREFFPKNRVEYFVSYYDYYQPEAYIPSSDTYIEKDSSISARSCAGWWSWGTSATTSRSRATSSACGATRSRSFPRTRSARCAFSS